MNEITIINLNNNYNNDNNNNNDFINNDNSPLLKTKKNNYAYAPNESLIRAIFNKIIVRI